jgi:hypothetical protein
MPSASDPTNAWAQTGQTGDGAVIITPIDTLTLTIINQNIAVNTGVDGQKSSVQSQWNVSSGYPNGYDVEIGIDNTAANTTSGAGSTNLVNDTDSTKVLTPANFDGTANNISSQPQTWGFANARVNGASNTFATDSPTGYTVPAYGSFYNFITATRSAVGGDNWTMDIGWNTDNSTLTGTYNNQLLYTVVPNP